MVCEVVLGSGVSRVWQAWLVPWAPLWQGRKICLVKFKICDFEFPEPLFYAPYNHQLQSCINTAPLSNALTRGVAYYKRMHKPVVLWCSTTVRHCARTRTLTCHIYKTSFFSLYM